MRHPILFSLALALIAGCAPPGLYHREGVTARQLQTDEARCALEAQRVVPANIRTRRVPGTRQPRQICNAAGHCSTIWVQITPDRWESYDANDGARQSYARNCMIAKGYQRVSLPACPAEIAETATIAPGGAMPPLTGASCAVRLQGGGWQVVTPPGPPAP